MDNATLTQFFGWSLVINSVMLALFVLALVSCQGFVIRTHGRLFKLSEESLIQSYFNYLGLFKILIVVFNLTPFIALKLMA